MSEDAPEPPEPKAPVEQDPAEVEAEQASDGTAQPEGASGEAPSGPSAEPEAEPEPEPLPEAVLRVVEGDLLDQDVEVIVNAWNRNVFPWWLLIPQGVSRAIKQRAGVQPFRELRAFGKIPLGGAVVTSAGELPHRAIIHVAGINLLWRTSTKAIVRSAHNALELVAASGYASVAFPLIGAGSGGGRAQKVETILREELVEHARALDYHGEILIVRYAP